MPASFTRRLLPSLSDVVFIVVVLLVLWLGSFITIRDGDLGWHIATGRVILSTGAVPQVDLFSYTDPSRRFIPHEWLAEVIFASIFAVAGFGGVVLLISAIIGLTFAGLTTIMIRRGINVFITIPLIALGVLTSIAHWAPRPHMFTFLFTLVWATRLEQHRRQVLPSKRPLTMLWWLLPMLLLWVNTHGAFLIAFELTATYLGAALVLWASALPSERALYHAQVRDLSLLIVLSIPVTALNPVGFDLLRYSLDFVSQSYLRDIIPELQSPNFHDALFTPLLLLLMIAFATSVRRELTPTLLLVSWAAFVLISFRNIPQFIIICLPFIAESAQDLLLMSANRLMRSDMPHLLHRAIVRIQRIESGFTMVARHASGGLPGLIGLVVVAVLMANGVRFDLWGGDYSFREPAFPIRAVEHLKPLLPGKRMFNDAQWGGYLSFCCWPEVKTFVDGRVDMFGEAYMRGYYRAIDAKPGWKEFFDQYRIDLVMIDAARPLAYWLEHDPDWRLLYRDETAVVFVRANP
jgi:hypothetical protein